MPFTLHQKDSSTNARLGTLELPHGRVQTPIFMPVGTQGSVKPCIPRIWKVWARKLSWGIRIICLSVPVPD